MKSALMFLEKTGFIRLKIDFEEVALNELASGKKLAQEFSQCRLGHQL